MSFRDFIKQDYAKWALAIILIGTLLRFTLAAVGHPAGDSCWHLSVSRFIAETGRIPLFEPFGITDREVFTAPPLFHIFSAGVYWLFARISILAAEFAIKLISPLFGSITLMLIFLLGRKMFNPRIAFFATVFVTFLPIHINSSVVSFVESLSCLLAIVSVYLLLKKKIYLSALFIGLCLASKQMMFFMLPIFFLGVLFFYRSRLVVLLEKCGASALIICVVGLPWYIRNYILVGNPIWPFLFKFFGGKVVPHIPGFFPLTALSLSSWAGFYLDAFGAPLGSLAALSFVHLPFQNFFVFGWLVLTAFFAFPIVIGVFLLKKFRLLLFGWIGLFFIVLVMYLMNTGWAQARIMLPAIFAFAVLWAFGIDWLLKKVSFKVFGVSVVVLLLIGCAICFSGVESAKTLVGAKNWAVYQPDFDWIKANTPADSRVAYRGQCLSYNVDRPSNFDLDKADYVWVNQNFNLEPFSILEQDILVQVQMNFKKVYEDSSTGTQVYGKDGS
jgi:4-amino-4-deoxy-L-arabinose transferase-like glycosyltransferase